MPIERFFPNIRIQIRDLSRHIWFTKKVFKEPPSPGIIAERFNMLLLHLDLSSRLSTRVIFLQILGKQNVSNHNEKLFYTQTHGIKAFAAVEITAAIYNTSDPTLDKNGKSILHSCGRIFQVLDGTINEEMLNLPDSAIERILESAERKDI